MKIEDWRNLCGWWIMEAFNNNFVLDLINFDQWKKREQKKLLPWEEKRVTVEGGVVGEKEVSKGKEWDEI